MKPLALWISISLVIACSAASAQTIRPAGESGSSAPGDAAIPPSVLTIAPSTQPATQPVTRPATQPAGEGEKVQEKDKSSERLLRAVKKSLVVVKVWYQKDLTESAQVIEDRYEIGRIYRSFVDRKLPEERAGVVLDNKGHVLIVDDALEDRFLKRIEVVDIDGNVHPVKRAGLLEDAPGVILEVEAAAKTLRPLKFATLPDDAGPETSLQQVGLHKVDDQWRMRISPLYPSVRYGPGEQKNVFYGARNPGAYSRRYSSLLNNVTVIADEEGRPVGCSLATFMDLNETECIWKGASLRRTIPIEWSSLSREEAVQRSRLGEAAQEIVIKLRQGSVQLPRADSSSYSRYSRSSSGAAGREVTTFGIAISPTDILIPMPLNRKAAAQIDRIYVKLSSTVRKQAEFVAALKDFGAFVVRVKEGKLPAYVEVADDDLPRMKPFRVARMRKKAGRKYVDLTRNRIFGKARGYAGEYHWYAAMEIRPPSLLVSFDGKLAGLYVQQRIEHEEERRLEMSGGYSSARPEIRIFTASEIRDVLAKPADHADPKIKVTTATEAKRHAWFGVEYVPVNKNLAEQFKAEKPTKDGQQGFIVNAVYSDSPAEKLGIREGDILLRIEAPGRPYPIELNARLAGDDRYGYSRWYGDEDEERLGPLSPTWKNRKNFLTRLLDAVGVGKKVKMTFCRPDDEQEAPPKTQTLEYTIEQAPRDLESAPKWQNRKLGLTVKDMTYEVRHALSLPADAPGVILAKIEPGSPTLIARVFPNEIITHLGETPLTSARQMRDLVSAAHKAGEKKVRLKVLRLGETRFADLTVSDYDASDDEGMEEE